MGWAPPSGGNSGGTGTPSPTLVPGPTGMVDPNVTRMPGIPKRFGINMLGVPLTPGVGVTPSGDGHGGGNTNSPLDPASRIALQQAAAARQTYMSNIRQQQQQEEQNYGDSLYDMHYQHPIDVRNLLNNYGARGILFGSGYGNATGQLADTYGTNLSRLAAARTAALSGFDLQRSNYNHEYGVNLAAIRQAAADRISANAGHLGLGNGNKQSAKKQADTVQGNGS